MNVRQEWFISKIQGLSFNEISAHAQKVMLEQMWQEEFRTTKENALDVVDLSQKSITYANILSYFNNNVADGITFIDGGSELDNVERGRFARRIMSQGIQLL